MPLLHCSHQPSTLPHTATSLTLAIAPTPLQTKASPHPDQHGVDIILITVCSSGAQVSPGMTDTDMISDSLPSFDLNQIPMGRVGTPAEIADVVFYLLSDGASYVSGANVRVFHWMGPIR